MGAMGAIGTAGNESGEKWPGLILNHIGDSLCQVGYLRS